MPSALGGRTDAAQGSQERDPMWNSGMSLEGGEGQTSKAFHGTALKLFHEALREHVNTKVLGPPPSAIDRVKDFHLTTDQKESYLTAGIVPYHDPNKDMFSFAMSDDICTAVQN